MSGTEEYERVQVANEGVQVLKRFAADEFPVPAIAFDFTSRRNDAVTVRLADTVPEDINVEDLGFHPDYGSEFWTIEEEQIVFEREFEPGATYTTVYGIRAAGDSVESFLTEPTIESVEPPLPEETADSASDEQGDIVLESDDSVVEDALNAGFETAEEETDTTDEAIPTLNLEGSPASDTETTHSPDIEQSTPSVSGEQNLASELAAEIRNGEIPQEDIEQLQQALNPDGGSTTARLDQIQRDITDLRAYANALEEFLDEHGTGEELIGEFSQQITEFEEAVERLETEVIVGLRRSFDELDESFEALESDVSEELERVDEVVTRTDELDEVTDDLAERIDGAAGRTAELTRRFETFEERTDTLEERFESVETDATDAIEQADAATKQTAEIRDQFEDVESRTEDIAERFEAVETQADGIDERFETVESRTDDMTERTDELVERLDELVTRTDEIVERVDETQEDIEDLRGWKQQIMQTFGG